MNPDRLKKNPASPAASLVSASGSEPGPGVTTLDPITEQVLAEVTVATNSKSPTVQAPVLSPADPPARKLPVASLLVAGGALLCGVAALSLRGRHG